MAVIFLNKGEQSLINTWLVGTTGATDPGASFGVGLAKVTGGVAAMSKTWVQGTDPATTIAEIGRNTAAGYARQVLNRNDDAGTPKWPAATLSTNYLSTGTTVTFTFSGTPDLNGATVWFVALGTSIGSNDIVFCADLGGTRTYGIGDTQTVTPTFKAT